MQKRIFIFIILFFVATAIIGCGDKKQTEINTIGFPRPRTEALDKATREALSGKLETAPMHPVGKIQQSKTR